MKLISFEFVFKKVSFSPTRLMCFIGVILVLIPQKSEAATQASCVIQNKVWFFSKDHALLKICFANIMEIPDENFTISSGTNPTVLGFELSKKYGVMFLPTNFFSVFPELLAIRMDHCSVLSIDDNHLKGLSKLWELDLNFNEIDHVAGNAFIDLTSLRILRLRGNQINVLDENTFTSLKALRELHLNSNKIESLHPKIFRSLVSVEVINLIDNKISSLDENIFESLVNLETIDIGYNKLEIIPKDLFKNNFKLVHIVLRKNKIKFIGVNMFNHIWNLLQIDLVWNSCVDKIFFVRNSNFLLDGIDVDKNSDVNSMESKLRRNCTENAVNEAFHFTP